MVKKTTQNAVENPLGGVGCAIARSGSAGFSIEKECENLLKSQRAQVEFLQRQRDARAASIKKLRELIEADERQINEIEIEIFKIIGSAKRTKK